MAYNLNSYKCAGVIYRIDEMSYTKKANYPKRSFYLEVPSMNSGMQKTEIFKFVVMGDQAGSLDWYAPGDWVQVLFKIEGRWWKPPDSDEKILLQSLRPIDLHKSTNPFLQDPYEMSQDPDDHSPDFQANLTKDVKDWANQPPQSDLFNQDNEPTDLPF